MALSFMQSVSRVRVAGSVRRVLALGLVFGSIGLHAQAVDPGVRAGAGATTTPLPGLSAGQLANFTLGFSNFITVRSVQGNEVLASGAQTQEGLGPRYNSSSCGSCHSQPVIGGTSPSTTAPPFVGPNPQVAVATEFGATNVLPYFVTANGPVREARFKHVVQNGVVTRAADGSVHDLFTITGRTDATNTAGATGTLQTCVLAQPDFNAARHANNISFRIPTPLFGVGLMESISDATILANMAANASDKQAFRIRGTPNRNGNDGTITKFGWKAQNATALLFAGEAYNVEMGVSNEIFSVERANSGETLPTSCLFNPIPEDATAAGDNTGLSDVQQFAAFMEGLAPPTPVSSFTNAAGVQVLQASITNGAALFSNTVKCALCHTPTLMSSPSNFTGRTATAVNLFSDLLLHNMGDELADDVSQGLAGPNQFRTAPLWGLGQRIFFLHDGRTTDLVQVIRMHGDSESEARVSVEQFERLSVQSQQDLLNFLRSL
jgi:CxxC motif-containing protein (DUF1111 family)